MDVQTSGAQRIAVRVLQLGAVAAVIAATTHRGFDLDRFLVPKELALHATAVIAGLLTLRARMTRVDAILFAFVLLGALSAIFAANPWLAVRALAVTASSVVVFRAARAVPSAPVLNGLAFAVVLAASLSLLQAYGVELSIFSPNRAPGGTMGNRNFVGHAAAFGLPLVLLAVLRGSRLAPPGVSILVCALVLTRSRGAWLAAAAVAVVFLAGIIRARAWKALAAIVVCVAAGGAAALLIPNTLRWRSDNPYLESLAGVASYDEGSGRGRLVQYAQSLRMAAAHPLLGVGPGNWPVVYPAHARRGDPSLDPNAPGMTHNPWPSSDWIAFISERGPAAALLLAGALLTIALAALREREDVPRATALLGTVAGAVVTGAFDAVLLLGAPSLIVWAALGALVPRLGEERPARWGIIAAVILVTISAAGATRSTAQLLAMELYTRGEVRRAARIDPGNFRAHLRLARSGSRKVRCAHAQAAHALYPNAAAARRLRCR